ncbi:hypothetical protein ACFQVC_08075 [Streptomyces monticola]|uniref:Uncharacterized protein n=1 Tax=Streptomyces monticola TaxID=2666263 RepID=A0ABW2JEB8_9ACTN
MTTTRRASQGAKKSPAKKAAGKAATTKAAPSAKKATRSTSTRTRSASATSATAHSTPAKAKASKPAAHKSTRSHTAKSTDGYTLTIPPVSHMAAGVANAAKAPLAKGHELLTAKKGLPVYLGLGGAAVLGVLELPVAAAAGGGYAVLRQWGPTRGLLGGGGKTAHA